MLAPRLPLEAVRSEARDRAIARLAHVSWKQRRAHGGYWKEVWYRRSIKPWLHRLRWVRN